MNVHGAVLPPAPDSDADAWFDWLTRQRHGGDAAYAAQLEPKLAQIRDRLLDHAALVPGQTILDLGCGDGFAGFGALERQPAGTVTFADMSPALIARARAAAEQRGLGGRCRFLVTRAPALDAVAAASFDVVLIRAVLAYCPDRAAVLAECRRVLRPGGRLSLVDPIFQDRAFALAGMAAQLRSSEPTPATRLLELVHRSRAAHFPDALDAIASNPLTNYNERDLLRFVETAGFVNVHLRLHIDSIPAAPASWAAFLAGTPYAGAASVASILAARFSPGERTEFERFMRPRIEAGAIFERNTDAYIFADAPAPSS